MIGEMTTALKRHGFDWKKEPLRYMNTLSPDAEGSMVIDNVEPAVELPHVHVMDVLGVRIDKRFREHHDIYHRWELAEKHSGVIKATTMIGPCRQQKDCSIL
eukprot:3401273-Pyramimonas_sp.AAC.1